MKVSEEQFKKIYGDSLKEILSFRPIDENLRIFLARHENCYLTYNFEEYLEKSWQRCWNVYQLLPDLSSGDVDVLDVGGFFGNISLCLHRLGYKVTLAEAYGYYGGLFDNLREFLEKEGLTIIDYDFSKEIDINQKYKNVLCLAVLEHLAHSPKLFMENLKKAMDSVGMLVLEVPNIAYWPKRYQLLKGKSNLTNIETIYKSEPPFLGHHHEYTKEEIEKLAELAGFKIEKLSYFNYSMVKSFKNVVNNLPAFIFDSCKEGMLVILRLE